MVKQGAFMRIDIRYADTDTGEKSDARSHLQKVKYVALDDKGVVRLDKLYDSATPWNSIDFVKHVIAHVRIPINSILTDYGTAFNSRAFLEYLAPCGIQHRCIPPHMPYIR